MKLLIPSRVLIERTVNKVAAEAQDGMFCLLPHHVDIVAPLVPGLLTYSADDGEETLAVDTGILVKCGDEVSVSVRRAVRGKDVDELVATVRGEFLKLDEAERKSRAALARLEAAFVTDFTRMQLVSH